MSGALDGIRVIDFGQYIAGPFAALLLADAGAEVVRVDPPGGPRWDHPANATLQRGKRSVILDLHHESDRATARRLIAAADVVIENFRPGVMGRFGLGPEEQTAQNARLIYCSLPGFGHDDPRAGLRAFEGVVAAGAGLYSPNLRRTESREPVFTALPLASVFGALVAAHGIVAALIARERDGQGQALEVPLFDASFEVIGSYGETVDGVPFGGPSDATRNRAWIKQHKCQDGRWVDISPPLRGIGWFADRFLPKDLVASGVTDIGHGTPEGIAQTEAALNELFSSKPAADWERIANEEAGIGLALCQTSDEWLHDPHANDSGCVMSVDDPLLGTVRMPGYAVHLSRTPLTAGSPRHETGVDTPAVVADLERRLGDDRRAGGPPPSQALSRALEGVNVIDVSAILAGPTATRILSQYGANVIKINKPLFENFLYDTGHNFVNRGKRSILLNLKSLEGIDIFWKLAEHADVFHHNFVAGTTDRLGIGEEDFRKRHPDIVYSSVSTHAYGGFRGAWRGHEELGQAVTGMEVRFGGDGQPMRQNLAVCDYSTGHLSAFGILLALFHRQRTGEGQFVQASLSRSGTFLQIPFMLDYEGKVWDEPRGQDTLGWGPLDRLYRASNGWFYLAALGPGDKGRLAQVEGLGAATSLDGDELAQELAERFASGPVETWVAKIVAAGVSAERYRFVHDSMADPVVEQRGISRVFDSPGIGAVRGVAITSRLSRTPVSIQGVPAPLGRHSRELLAELGMEGRLDELAGAGIVTERRIMPV